MASEHRDIYIAAAVGGVGFVLLMLYLYNGNAPASAGGVVPDASSPTGVTVVPPSLPTPYTYNVTPYDPSPAIIYGATPAPANSNGNGSDCCGGQTCGPIGGGGQYFDTTVAQFSTLMGTGAA